MGVSTSYYVRLEQGQSLNASEQVIDGIARALRLDGVEHEHLRALARPAPARRTSRKPPVERISPATAELLAAIGDVPAIVLGRRTDVLAWNPMGHIFFAGHLDPASPERPADRPNMARLAFLDTHTRELYVDWQLKARAVIGNLRLLAGRHPEDQALTTLIGELSTRSTEFATMWADHRVRVCHATEYDMHHPIVGALTVNQQTLSTIASDQVVCLVTAAPGSPSQAALAMLAQADAD